MTTTSASILVVEDHREIADLVRLHLHDAGYHASTVGDGRTALASIRSSRCDLVILDLMLPDMDGFSICEILRCQPSTADIPVIFLTAMAGEIPRLHGFEVGATDYCVKPIRTRDLRDRVKNILEAKAAKLSAAEAETANAGLA